MEKMIKSALIASSLTLLSTAVSANDTARLEVKVEVNNVFSAEASQALDFGTLRVQGDDTDVASIKIEADPNLTDPEISNNGDAIINVITAGQAGQITVADAAPNTELSITVPSGITVNSVGNASFDLTDLEFFMISGARANTEVTDNKFRVDDTGAAILSVGATLSTQALSGTDTYGDGTYEAKVDIEIAY